MATRSSGSSWRVRRSTPGCPPRSKRCSPRRCCPRSSPLVTGLLDGLASQGFADLPIEARTQVVLSIREMAPEAKLGLDRLKGLTFLFFYALPDEQGGNPNWEAIGYPGPVSRAARCGGGAQDDQRRGGLRRERDAERRRLRRRLRLRRLGDRRQARRRRQEGARPRDGRLPQRAGLQPARAARLSGALLRRWARCLGERVDRDPRRPDARWRHCRQLHELHPDARAHRRRVVGARHRRPRRRRGLPPRPHRHGAGADQRQHRGDDAERASTGT